MWYQPRDSNTRYKNTSGIRSFMSSYETVQHSIGPNLNLMETTQKQKLAVYQQRRTWLESSKFGSQSNTAAPTQQNKNEDPLAPKQNESNGKADALLKIVFDEGHLSFKQPYSSSMICRSEVSKTILPDRDHYSGPRHLILSQLQSGIRN